MKTRVTRKHVRNACIEYDNYAHQIIRGLFSPAYMEIIKNEMFKFQQLKQSTETNPAFWLPMLFEFDIQSNTLTVSLDLTEALVIDEYA